jgi:hypothetical protein
VFSWILQDVEGLPSGAGGTSSSIRDVKRSKKGEVSWLMATTYLTRYRLHWQLYPLPVLQPSVQLLAMGTHLPNLTACAFVGHLS